MAMGLAIAVSTTDTTDDAWYDITGHRFHDKPSTPGIYIHNGKKLVIKWEQRHACMSIAEREQVRARLNIIVR